MGSIKEMCILYIVNVFSAEINCCYATDMMAVLYNFVKVDTEMFLSNVKHVEIVITMCKSVSVCNHSDVYSAQIP